MENMYNNKAIHELKKKKDHIILFCTKINLMLLFHFWGFLKDLPTVEEESS